MHSKTIPLTDSDRPILFDFIVWGLAVTLFVSATLGFLLLSTTKVLSSLAFFFVFVFSLGLRFLAVRFRSIVVGIKYKAIQADEASILLLGRKYPSQRFTFVELKKMTWYKDKTDSLLKLKRNKVELHTADNRKLILLHFFGDSVQSAIRQLAKHYQVPLEIKEYNQSFDDSLQSVVNEDIPTVVLNHLPMLLLSLVNFAFLIIFVLFVPWLCLKVLLAKDDLSLIASVIWWTVLVCSTPFAIKGLLKGTWLILIDPLVQKLRYRKILKDDTRIYFTHIIGEYAHSLFRDTPPCPASIVIDGAVAIVADDDHVFIQYAEEDSYTFVMPYIERLPQKIAQVCQLHFHRVEEEITEYKALGLH